MPLPGRVPEIKAEDLLRYVYEEVLEWSIDRCGIHNTTRHEVDTAVEGRVIGMTDVVEKIAHLTTELASVRSRLILARSMRI